MYATYNIIKGKQTSVHIFWWYTKNLLIRLSREGWYREHFLSFHFVFVDPDQPVDGPSVNHFTISHGHEFQERSSVQQLQNTRIKMVVHLVTKDLLRFLLFSPDGAVV